MEANGVTALPEDVPEEVELLDESWLSQQTAEGARLTLVEPRELERLEGAASALRDKAQTDLAGLEARLATQQSANSALLATVHELEKQASGREKTIRAIDCQLRLVQDEASELHRALDFAERPLWRRLLRLS